MKPKYDPYQIFKKSKTPAGLYARKKWFNEDHADQWKDDFDKCVSDIMNGQDSSGSWDNSIIITVHKLFGLHLTVRESNGAINKALDWLIAQLQECDLNSALDNTEIDYSVCDLKGLPFSPSNRDVLLMGSTLFLASIFGRQNDESIISTYNHLNDENVRRLGNWGNWKVFNNLFRAFVVHLEYSRCEGTTLAADALYQIQYQEGSWDYDLPIYQTINALAHLDLEVIDRQLEKSFGYLFETQNPDGTWGDSQQEWNTFLIVHALRNKKIL